MKKQIKDLTREEMNQICDKFVDKCKNCPLYNKRSKACARLYFDTITSKFSDDELEKEVLLNE